MINDIHFSKILTAGLIKAKNEKCIAACNATNFQKNNSHARLKLILIYGFIVFK